jgi:hypothetical protein
VKIIADDVDLVDDEARWVRTKKNYPTAVRQDKDNLVDTYWMTWSACAPINNRRPTPRLNSWLLPRHKHGKPRCRSPRAVCWRSF